MRATPLRSTRTRIAALTLAAAICIGTAATAQAGTVQFWFGTRPANSTYFDTGASTASPGSTSLPTLA